MVLNSCNSPCLPYLGIFIFLNFFSESQIIFSFRILGLNTKKEIQYLELPCFSFSHVRPFWMDSQPFWCSQTELFLEILIFLSIIYCIHFHFLFPRKCSDCNFVPLLFLCESAVNETLFYLYTPVCDFVRFRKSFESTTPLGCICHFCKWERMGFDVSVTFS